MSLIGKIKDRLDEPSTYAGVAAIVAGAGQVFEIDKAAPVAEAINTAAANPGPTGLMLMLLGILAVFKREKGEKK